MRCDDPLTYSLHDGLLTYSVHGATGCRVFTCHLWKGFVKWWGWYFIWSEGTLSCNSETMIHCDTCSSGRDHEQISSWALPMNKSRHGPCPWWLPKNIFPLLSCMINLFMGESNGESSSWTSREAASLFRSLFRVYSESISRSGESII